MSEITEKDPNPCPFCRWNGTDNCLFDWLPTEARKNLNVCIGLELIPEGYKAGSTGGIERKENP